MRVFLPDLREGELRCLQEPQQRGIAFQAPLVNDSVALVDGISGRTWSVPLEQPLVHEPGRCCDARRAWSRSAMMSATSSMPTEIRTYSGVTPVSTCSSGVSCECVVDAG